MDNFAIRDEEKGYVTRDRTRNDPGDPEYESTKKSRPNTFHAKSELTRLCNSTRKNRFPPT